MLRFVIHEHHAKKLHYDLRLEIDSVLKSWAIPKEPSNSYSVRRLAIQVEDHALDYIDFEGEITEGYGKGKVFIWDSGEFIPEKIKDDEIIFELKGNKLNGKFVLLKMKKWEKGNEWLWYRVKKR